MALGFNVQGLGKASKKIQTAYIIDAVTERDNSLSPTDIYVPCSAWRINDSKLEFNYN